MIDHEAYEGTAAYLNYVADKELRRLQNFGTPEEIEQYITAKTMSPFKRFDVVSTITNNKMNITPMSHGRALIFKSKLLNTSHFILVENKEATS